RRRRRLGMNSVERAACFLAAILAASALGVSAARAQAEPPDGAGGDQGRGAAAPEASQAARGREIEEIVVTAERREERLHDVPVSMSALDAGFMRQQGVTDLQDVSRYVPNVRFSQ